MAILYRSVWQLTHSLLASSPCACAVCSRPRIRVRLLMHAAASALTIYPAQHARTRLKRIRASLPFFLRRLAPLLLSADERVASHQWRRCHSTV
jgi:hypothetical protein